MSRSKLITTLKLLALTICGVAIGVGAMIIAQNRPQTVRRSVASIESGFKPNRLVLGKHAAAMSVEIVGPETFPNDSESLVELVGFITQNIEGDSWLDYKWSLPAGVSLVQGQISGSFEGLALGQPHRISLLVSGFTSDTQKLISLSSHLEKANAPLTASAVIVSRPEDTAETRVMNLQALAAEKAAEEKSKEE
ncbi:MAG: hypothetical protein IPM97_04290 [Bdellovibrionaceae bacterium]|nr:hypothetical protein [Pseudobdellovibrionaceae bacterium]